MRLVLFVLLLVLAIVAGRSVHSAPGSQQTVREPIHDQVNHRQPETALTLGRDDIRKIKQLIIKKRSGGDLTAEERSFVDLLPYVGNFILRGLVRKVVIKPVIGGFKRLGSALIPTDFYTYYKQKLMSKRFFKLISPLSPLVSSYAYNKFEQGVFWTLKRGYTYVADNFIEFE